MGKTIDAVGTVTNALEILGEKENIDPKSRAELRGVDRQLMQILLFLQVGERSQQRTEALRAALLELPDHLFGTDKEAPDLQVNMTSFDKNLLPAETTTRCRRMISTPSSTDTSPSAIGQFDGLTVFPHPHRRSRQCIGLHHIAARPFDLPELQNTRRTRL